MNHVVNALAKVTAPPNADKTSSCISSAAPLSQLLPPNPNLHAALRDMVAQQHGSKDHVATTGLADVAPVETSTHDAADAPAYATWQQLPKKKPSIGNASPGLEAVDIHVSEELAETHNTTKHHFTEALSEREHSPAEAVPEEGDRKLAGHEGEQQPAAYNIQYPKGKSGLCFSRDKILALLASGLDMRAVATQLSRLGYKGQEAVVHLKQMWTVSSPRLGDVLRSYRAHVEGYKAPRYDIFLVGVFGLEMLNSLRNQGTVAVPLHLEDGVRHEVEELSPIGEVQSFGWDGQFGDYVWDEDSGEDLRGEVNEAGATGDTATDVAEGQQLPTVTTEAAEVKKRSKRRQTEVQTTDTAGPAAAVAVKKTNMGKTSGPQAATAAAAVVNAATKGINTMNPPSLPDLLGPFITAQKRTASLAAIHATLMQHQQQSGVAVSNAFLSLLLGAPPPALGAAAAASTTAAAVPAATPAATSAANPSEAPMTTPSQATMIQQRLISSAQSSSSNDAVTRQMMAQLVSAKGRASCFGCVGYAPATEIVSTGMGREIAAGSQQSMVSLGAGVDMKKVVPLILKVTGSLEGVAELMSGKHNISLGLVGDFNWTIPAVEYIRSIAMTVAPYCNSVL
ncbi:hypothetical protein CEUSTIGMA_g5263.t1 [Chlamydomonas eustigma]|uniref:Uncharacterized protein n=1 Tax=Chlamydomonas eustigma TaxID=1157962 RepID=A0A250X4Y3_9CHLO|nr:hypothetical protein CEUSTIGMA_g5263.t1 [Chlamydomonas eustigma]|eukprot:GAX77820.1 hypothetical protein CEUSTIGMA_g5263.t1 [Chlamydomonas eustigma]